MSSKVWPVVMLVGAIVASSFGTFAATYSPTTDGAVQASGDWNLTTLLNGGIATLGGIAGLLGLVKTVFQKSTVVVDGIQAAIELLKKNGITVPDVVPTPVVPVPVPNPIPTDSLSTAIAFIKSHGVEGKVQFVDGKQLYTLTIEPHEEAAAALMGIGPTFSTGKV